MADGSRLYVCGTNAHNPKDWVINVSRFLNLHHKKIVVVSWYSSALAFQSNAFLSGVFDNLISTLRHFRFFDPSHFIMANVSFQT